jgi:hypothetical protein
MLEYLLMLLRKVPPWEVYAVRDRLLQLGFDATTRRVEAHYLVMGQLKTLVQLAENGVGGKLMDLLCVEDIKANIQKTLATSRTEARRSLVMMWICLLALLAAVIATRVFFWGELS